MHRRAQVGLVLSMCCLSALARPLTPAEVEAIRDTARASFERDSLPGLQIAVAIGTDVWSEGIGAADLEQNVAVDRRSMFRTASISKWLTATAANRLVDARKLDLDAPIQQYCPQFPRKQATITPRYLLTHLSGIRHYHGANGESPRTPQEREALEERRGRERANRSTRYTNVVETLDAFKDDPLIREPGSAFLYSSLGYRVLACVLEGAAQRPYRELMKELVFAPAGLTLIVEDDALAIVPHRVGGYSRDGRGGLTRARFRDVSENLPAGGHLAAGQDLVRFAIAFNSGTLSATARDRMLEHPRLSDGSRSPFVPSFLGLGDGVFYGMGVFVGEIKGDRFIAHTGNQDGTSTELLLLPRRNVAIAIMTNVDDWRGGHALATGIAARIQSD